MWFQAGLIGRFNPHLGQNVLIISLSIFDFIRGRY